jgi:hypothetical protein
MAAGYMYFYFGKQHCVLMTVSDKMEGTFNWEKVTSQNV